MGCKICLAASLPSTGCRVGTPSASLAMQNFRTPPSPSATANVVSCRGSAMRMGASLSLMLPASAPEIWPFSQWIVTILHTARVQ